MSRRIFVPTLHSIFSNANRCNSTGSCGHYNGYNAYNDYHNRVTKYFTEGTGANPEELAIHITDYTRADYYTEKK